MTPFSPTVDFREFQLRVTFTLPNKYKYVRPTESGEKSMEVEKTLNTTGSCDSRDQPFQFSLKIDTVNIYVKIDCPH